MFAPNADLVFQTVALPLCMLVLAHLFSRYIQERDSAKAAGG